MEPINSVVLPLGAGASDRLLGKSAELGQGTLNLILHPTFGGLVNYAGKDDVFIRIVEPVITVPTPPSDDYPITRVLAFRDSLSKEHLVFVQDGKLYERIGNGFKLLYTFVGRREGELCFPTLFVHESKLIFVLPGDPPMLWDGYVKPHPLGVTEIPIPPEVRATDPPGQANLATGGMWAWANIWWTQTIPLNGPAKQQNADGDKIHGLYQTVLQYKDRFGNHGRVSPANPPALCPAVDDSLGWDRMKWLVARWARPELDEHVTGVVIGRSLNLHKDAISAELGKWTRFYTEHEVDNPVEQAFVHQLTDTSLLTAGVMDQEVGPPRQASIGWSWGGMVFLAGHTEDEAIFTWSDFTLSGQFRASQERRCPYGVKAGLPLQDRTVVITAGSTEVFYVDKNSKLALLEQYHGHGSKWGRTFVSHGGLVFGLWNQGWGSFDGTKHEYYPAPYWLKSVYVDSRPEMVSATVHGEWYLLTARIGSSSDGNNRLLKFHIPTRSWFECEESVYDVAYWPLHSCFVAGDVTSIHQLDAGLPDASSLVIENLMPPQVEIGTNVRMTSVSLLMEPAGQGLMTADLEGYFQGPEQTSYSAMCVPSVNRGDDQVSTATLYLDQPFSQVGSWAGPSRAWIQLRFPEPLDGFVHRLQMHFPAYVYLHLLALRLEYSAPLVLR